MPVYERVFHSPHPSQTRARTNRGERLRSGHPAEQSSLAASHVLAPCGPHSALAPCAAKYAVIGSKKFVCQPPSS